MDMTYRISSKPKKILSKSGGALYTRAKRLRGSIVLIPFSVAVTISFIYLRWRYPPLGLQDLVVFSAPFLLGIVLYCKAWIYRFPAGAPLLALSLGGALFFPMVVCVHIPYYDIVDNGIGLALAVGAWGLSTYLIWRLLQPSRDMFWNAVLEPLRRNPRRWLVITLVPLIWAGYGFGAFQLVDTQFDGARGELLRLPASPNTIPTARSPACVTMRPGFLGARWYQRSACPPPLHL
jgi:hypothetical protein